MLAVTTKGILRSIRVKSDVTIGNIYLAIASFSNRAFATSIVRRALGQSSLTRYGQGDPIGLRHTVPTGKEFNKRVMTKRISTAKRVTNHGGSSGTI